MNYFGLTGIVIGTETALGTGNKKSGGSDGTRTRELLRDRPAQPLFFTFISLNQFKNKHSDSLRQVQVGFR